ncbi:MAG TPA: 2-dehydropantoate 2-reductase [Casimicrobiaceae bacterium]|nr:2-dehydropantoate 2-reductase [Casimicrobiaceae bacterium]
MKVCIFGAGAIGGYIGHRFARAGLDVSLIARGPHLAAMRRDGLRLLIDGREEVQRVRCTDAPEELGPQDYVVIALKAHSISGAIDSMQPLLDDHTTIVTSSNGLPYWYFDVAGVPFHGLALASVDPGSLQRRLLRPERAVGCVVFPATEIVAPGVIRHEHGGKFPIGEPDGRRTPRIEHLHAMFEAAGFDAPVRSDIRDEIWLKLWGNLCFNPVSALTCATIDVVATDAGTRAVLLSMMREAEAIGGRLGLRLRVDAERRMAGAAALGPHKMSMLQDLERGRPLEIEALVGVILELGRATGVPTPTVDVVHALIELRARTGAALASGTPVPRTDSSTSGRDA